MPQIGSSALYATSSPSSLKSAELPRSLDRHQRDTEVIPFPASHRLHWIYRARRIYSFFDRPLASLVSYTALHVLFVSVWLTFLSAISFLAMVLR
jgi:hypothetical protein